MDELSKANKSKFLTVYMPANFEVYPQLLKKVLPVSLHIKYSKMPVNYGKYICNNIQNNMNINCLNLIDEMINSKKFRPNLYCKNVNTITI